MFQFMQVFKVLTNRMHVMLALLSCPQNALQTVEDNANSMLMLAEAAKQAV